MDSLEKYKTKILKQASNEDVLNEIGYCYKQSCVDMFKSDSYWVRCYYFLKGLAHYRNITPMC